MNLRLLLFLMLGLIRGMSSCPADGGRAEDHAPMDPSKTGPTLEVGNTKGGIENTLPALTQTPSWTPLDPGPLMLLDSANPAPVAPLKQPLKSAALKTEIDLLRGIDEITALLHENEDPLKNLYPKTKVLKKSEELLNSLDEKLKGEEEKIDSLVLSVRSHLTQTSAEEPEKSAPLQEDLKQYQEELEFSHERVRIYGKAIAVIQRIETLITEMAVLHDCFESRGVVNSDPCRKQTKQIEAWARELGKILAPLPRRDSLHR